MAFNCRVGIHVFGEIPVNEQRPLVERINHDVVDADVAMKYVGILISRFMSWRG